MKKVISILMIMVLLVSMLAVATTANTVDDSQNKYIEDFIQYYGEYYRNAIYYEATTGNYKELYYHYSDENSEEPDWTLIYAVIDLNMHWEYYGVIVGNRAIYDQELAGHSYSRHYVYITELDEVIPLNNSRLDEILEHCPELTETLDELNYGQLIGDINDDYKINIIDATYIQRKLAGYQDTVSVRVCPTFRRVEIGVDMRITVGHHQHEYVGDFNRDGETTILDATAIQRKLAKLD